MNQLPLNKNELPLIREMLTKYKQGYISGLIPGSNITFTPSGCRNKIVSSTGSGGDSYIPPYLKTGGASWSGTGLVYDVTTLEYYFNGDKITSATQVTLDASDPVNNRLDAIVVDEAGVVSVIKGDASASPISPSVDESHILVQYILVEAGSTQPTIAKEDIYLENAEWTTSTYTTGTATGSIDFNNAVSPKQGVKCISANADARLGARFVRATSFDPYQYTMLSMWVRFTGSNVANNKSLNVRFENGAGALVANTINLFNFGLQRNLLNVWQLVVIPITSFGVLPTSVKGLKIIMSGGTVGQARQWDIDLISLTDNSVPSINEQAFNILKDGALVGQSSTINFKGAPITVTNDPINKKIDVEVIGGGTSALLPNGIKQINVSRDLQADDAGYILLLVSETEPVVLNIPYPSPLSVNESFGLVINDADFLICGYSSIADGLTLVTPALNENVLFTTTATGGGNYTFPVSTAVFEDKTAIRYLYDKSQNAIPLAFTKTKAEIDTLIAGNDLVAGALYEITGVHPTLYDDGTTSGTTIYLRAISGNQLEVQGMGKFFNPKYNQAVDGFGIWENKMYGTFSSISGTFDYQNKEAVTANNAATGILLADGMIQFVSGDWSTATSITGDVSSATATVAGFVTPTYSIGDKVIWGGYSWTNVNGNVGASTDVLNLNAEWSKNVYDTTNYNIAYDVIEYDYANDFIVRRYNEEANIDVKCSKAQFDLFYNDNGFTYHSISVQQFGNVLNTSTYNKGQLNIDVNNGYNESINFSGAYQYTLTFGSGAYQDSISFGNNSSQNSIAFGSSAHQYNLTFGSGAYQNSISFGNNAYQYNLTFGSSAHQDNLTFGSSAHQDSIAFGNNAYQNSISFGNNAYQYNLTFGNNAYQNSISFGNNAYQYNLTFGSGAYQYTLTFGSGAYQDTLTFGSGAYQDSIAFGSSAYQYNLTFGSSAYQYNLTFGSGAYQYNLTFGNNAYQNSISFGNNAHQYYLTFGSNANQRNLTFGSNANQRNLTFGSSAYQQYLNFAENTQLNYNNQTLNSNIEYVSFRTKAITVPDLSTATYIYDGNIKEVYQRPDNALKIRYYDNSDVLQIVDIDD